jgi:putative NIF3 family GTP cyclohydrolase 1 type 2
LSMIASSGSRYFDNKKSPHRNDVDFLIFDDISHHGVVA